MSDLRIPLSDGREVRVRTPDFFLYGHQPKDMVQIDFGRERAILPASVIRVIADHFDPKGAA